MKHLSFMAALLLLGSFIGYPQPASAFYYDPGFGSVVTQVVFAGWLGGVVALSRFRRKLGTLLAPWFRR